MTSLTAPLSPEFIRRELLELAAKAISLAGSWDEAADCFVLELGSLCWDPLADSSATEDLFTKLNMTLEDSTPAMIKVKSRLTGHSVQYPGFYTDANPLGAMRQAIVTVAARAEKGSRL